MPSIHCLCGTLISLGGIPSDNKFHIIPDNSVEEMVDVIQNKSTEEEAFDHFYSISRDLALCPNCGRIWVDKMHNGIFESYKKEETQF